MDKYLRPNTPKEFLFCGLFALIILAVAIFTGRCEDKKAEEYWNKTVEIRRWDSLNLKLEKSPFNNRGVYIINDSLYLVGYKLNSRNLDILKISTLIRKQELELPFNFKKEADNDTIWITDNRNKVHFWVFRAERDIVKFNLELPDTIYKEQQNVPIIFRLENTRAEVFSFDNMVHWWNTFPRIRRGNKIFLIEKPNNYHPREFQDTTIHIQKNEIVRIKYDYTLDEVFDFKKYKSGKYYISFMFFYEHKYNKELDDNTPSKQWFTKDYLDHIRAKYIESDRFTFYLK